MKKTQINTDGNYYVVEQGGGEYYPNTNYNGADRFNSKEQAELIASSFEFGLVLFCGEDEEFVLIPE